MIIYTNNPVVSAHFAQAEADCDVRLVTASAMDVLSAARSAVNRGSVLCSDPMAGVHSRRVRLAGKVEDKPLAINPYLSLAVTPAQDAVDFKSVQRINEAVSSYKKNARLRFMAHNDDAVLNFQKADLDILLSVLAKM